MNDERKNAMLASMLSVARTNDVLQQQELVRALVATHVRPLIDQVFPLQNIADAFQLQQTGGHFGKICLEI